MTGNTMHMGSNIPITTYMVDEDGMPRGLLTSVTCYIVRPTDGRFWNGASFQITPTGFTMTELSPSTLAGFYIYTLNTGALPPMDQIFVFISDGAGPMLDSLVIDFRLGEAYYISNTQLPPAITDIGSILVDTNQMQGKLPTNNIMGSSDKNDWNDNIQNIENIVNDIIDAISQISGTVVSDGGNTAITFKTSLTLMQDDFINDLQLLFTSGTNAGQSRRISDFVQATDFVTVDTAFRTTPSPGDTFVIISRFTGAGSTFPTPSQIATAVWSDVLPGSYTGSMAGKVVDDILTQIGIVDTNVTNIQSRLPSSLIGGRMRSHIEAKDSTLPLSAQEKLDVNAEADQALIDYDPPTKAELDTAEANIIAEIDANEVLINAIQTDVNTILARIGLPPTDLYTDLKAEIDYNEGLIVTLTGNLATHDTDIKNLIGTPIIDLITDMNNRFDAVDADNLANYNAIVQIQNNTTTVFIVPERLVRPDTGTKTYRVFVLNYDSVGNMEDFDSIPNIQGNYVSGGVFFASTPMTKPGSTTGEYYYDISIGPTETLGAVAIQVDAVEGGNPKVFIRTSEITDYDTELQEIYDLAEAIYNKTDSGHPSPTIPAQITTVEINLTAEIDENQDILETIRDDYTGSLMSPSVIAKNTGYTLLDNDGNPVLVGATEIPATDGFEDFFQQPEGYIIIDDGGPNEEMVKFNSIDTGIFNTAPTTIQHEDGETITEVTYIRLWFSIVKKDGSVLVQADSDPPISIYDTLGNVLASDTMTWYSVTPLRMYYYDLYLKATDQPRHLQVEVQPTVDGLTRAYKFGISMIDRPASSLQLEEAISGGIMPGTFVFDHDGWKDESNILHEWTDDMAGPLKDDTGKPATGILVRAFLKGTDGQYLLVNNPPYHDYSNIFGHYRGSLEAGTYLFAFYKDNYKWQEVEREIG